MKIILMCCCFIKFLPFFEGGLFFFFLNNLWGSFRGDHQLVNELTVGRWWHLRFKVSLMQCAYVTALRVTGTVPILWESSSMGSTFISSSLDFISSNSTAVADFELLNSPTSGLYISIDKSAFAYGQIILYLEEYSYCVFYSIEPSRVKCSLMHREELMIGRYRVGKLFILAPRKLKSWVKD